MLPAALRPLRHRGFALLWSAGLVSNVGTWMQTVAVGALVIDLTSQAAWAALAFVAGFLPSGILGPVGGALADRLDRRRFIIGVNLVEAALATLLAVLVATGRASPGLLLGVVFLGGCLGALRMPFQQALLPDLVPRSELVAAVSLGATQWNLGRVVGPALAGVVIAATSFSVAFVVNAASFFAVIGALVLVRLPRHDGGDEYHGLLQHIRAGARAARQEPACRAAIGLIAVAARLAAPFKALISAYADMLAGGDAKATAAATGALTTAQGAGAVVGALAFATLAERFGRRRMALIHLVATPVALVLYAQSPNVAVGTAGLFVVGGLYIGILSGLGSVVQITAPPAFRGRVISLYFATLSVVFAAGASAQGWIADRAGLRATTTGAAVLMFAAVLGLRALRPEVLDALDRRGAPEPDRAAVEGEAAPAAEGVAAHAVP